MLAIAGAAHDLGVATGRREICEGAVKKLKAQLANWRASVAKRPGFLALLLTGMADPLVVELERLVAVSEAELVGLSSHERQLREAYEQLQRRAAATTELRPKPLAKARPRASK